MASLTESLFLHDAAFVSRCRIRDNYQCNIGWPYGSFLQDTSLPVFLYCLKYPGFGCLDFADWSLYDIHENYSEQSRWLLMISYRSRCTFNDRCAATLQVEWTNKNVRVFDRSHRSHLLTCHVWSIIYNTCIILVNLLWMF